jgi:hypothetical protein
LIIVHCYFLLSAPCPYSTSLRLFFRGEFFKFFENLCRFRLTGLQTWFIITLVYFKGSEVTGGMLEILRYPVTVIGKSRC